MALNESTVLIAGHWPTGSWGTFAVADGVHLHVHAALGEAGQVTSNALKVEMVPANNATIFQAMDQGKGDIDVHPDVWLPNQESFTKKYVDGAGSVTLSSNPYQGNQGFCVSKDFAKANNITKTSA